MVGLRRPVLTVLIGLLAAGSAGPGRGAAGQAHDLLVLQATARMAVALAEGNHCAALELKPRIEATIRYLSEAPAPASPIVSETINLLEAARYDSVACDTPCPLATTTAGLDGTRTYGPEATSDHLAALGAVVTAWLQRAERDPPRLGIAVSRHSHDPLPRYLPGQPVDYLVHVGPSCHGAVLTIDREYELPTAFDGSGSFIPQREGLWSVHVTRRDGLPLSPLTYLDADTGLPSYYREFWVGTQAVRRLGPGGLGPWAQ